MIADRRADRLEAARERLAAAGRTVACRRVRRRRRRRDVERLMDTAVSTFGRLDVLVNNAGVFSNFLLEHMTPEEFKRIIGVNVGGALPLHPRRRGPDARAG